MAEPADTGAHRTAAGRVAALCKQLFILKDGRLCVADPADAPAQAALITLGQELLARADGEVDFHYERDFETLVVEGAHYAYDLFRGLGLNGLAVGTVVEIMKRQDGLVWLRTVKPCIGACATAPTSCPHCGEKLTEEA